MTTANEARSNSQALDANQWMGQVRTELEGLVANGCDIGQLEALIEKRLKELGRPLLEEAVQKLADRQPLSCPRCDGPLHVERHQRLRRVFSVFGKVPFVRSYGFCPRCQQRSKWRPIGSLWRH